MDEYEQRKVEAAFFDLDAAASDLGAQQGESFPVKFPPCGKRQWPV